MRMLLLLLVMLTVASAQPPRGFFPWWDSSIVKDLDLSDDQRKQIQATVRDYRTRLVDQRGAVEKAEVQVEEVFNEDDPDPKRVNDTVDRLIAARGELTRAYTQMSLRLRLILTPDQWRTLRQKRRSVYPEGKTTETNVDR